MRLRLAGFGRYVLTVQSGDFRRVVVEVLRRASRPSAPMGAKKVAKVLIRQVAGEHATGKCPVWRPAIAGTHPR